MVIREIRRTYCAMLTMQQKPTPTVASPSSRSSSGLLNREEAPMSKISPCLWFDGQAEEAANFYVSAFRDCGQDGAIGEVMRYGDAGPRPEGTVLTVSFTLADQEFIALNGGPHFTFSPAISLFVKCADQAEVDRFWEKLSDGGRTEQCGWLTDRFGVSWQVVPTMLGEMLRDADPARAGRVMQALMQMTKLEIDALSRAYDGGSTT
jgi:predicted 3-demethylubiquinone-9 3-methyltransferase (glyoxalase superfamily)